MSMDTMEIVIDVPANHSHSRKKWQKAYFAIYSTRAFASIASEVVADKNCFSGINLKSLAEIVKDKNQDRLLHFGGVEGLILALKSNATNGIKGHDREIVCRKEMFGHNTYQKTNAKCYSEYMMEAIKDPTIVILLICSVLSLGFGIDKHGLRKGWYDGGSIFFAILLVVVLCSLSNYIPNKQIDKFCEVNNQIKVRVTRNGRLQEISLAEVVVGDVVCLMKGDKVAADGLFLNGSGLRVDESSLTGLIDHVEVDCNQNPFLFAGTYVVDGNVQMLVTCVGINTTWGEILSSNNSGSQEWTPLQLQLNKLISWISRFILLVPFIILIMHLVLYFTGKMKDENGNKLFMSGKTKLKFVWRNLVGILAHPVAIAAAAVPEGVQLAFAITLAYSIKKLRDKGIQVRKLTACEAIAKANTICINKAAIFSLNKMEVTRFWLSQSLLSEGGASAFIAPSVVELMNQVLGTTLLPSDIQSSWIPVEEAISSYASMSLGMDIENLRESFTILNVESSDSKDRLLSILMRKKSDGSLHVHFKGLPEVLIARCSHYYDAMGLVKVIDDDAREMLEQRTTIVGNNGVQFIAFAHKQISETDFNGMSERGLIFLGLVSLRVPCLPWVRKAVKECQNAGVNIKLITEDDLLIAKSVAIQAGILDPDQDMNNGAVVQGKEFRNYTRGERIHKVGKIQVMANVTPLDKLLFIESLKHKNHVVAVTGHNTGDVQAMKQADIGLCIGLQSSVVAKESSDIVIQDSNFASLLLVLRWGRAIYNHIQIFIQFHFSACFTSLAIDFTTAVLARTPPTINLVAAITTGSIPFAALQVLWVKLIMGSLAAVALTIGQPNKTLMQSQPVTRSNPLVTKTMKANVLLQALYHITIVLILQLSIFFHNNRKAKDTFIFNFFVLSQVFNKLNSRDPNEANFFKGIYRNNKWFLWIIGVIIILQFVMVEFLQRFADIERLSFQQWVMSTLLAVLALLIGMGTKRGIRNSFHRIWIGFVIVILVIISMVFLLFST